MTIDFASIIEAFLFIVKRLPVTLFIPAVTLAAGIVLGSVIAIIRLRSGKFVNAVLATGVSFVVLFRRLCRCLSCITVCLIC